MFSSDCSTQPLSSPAELQAAEPLNAGGQRLVRETRERLAARLSGGRGPAVAIVGPCSIHDRSAALDYAERLRKLQRELGDEVLLVMRAYFEKPRTSLGWKGFLYDPDLDGSDDLGRGLREARRLLVELAHLGVPTATELLEPLVAPYLADTLSWAAIGARTTESQTHRQLASTLPLPVGFKNGTDGSVEAAVCAVLAARSKHSLMAVDAHGRLCVLQSPGNPGAHVVLRGGRSGPNYDAASVAQAAGALQAAGLDAALVVDCSHGNSGKDHRRQPVAAAAVIEHLQQRTLGVAGLMLESHLVAGRQELGQGPLVYGQSVTDACIDFETTAEVLRSLARSVRPRAGAGLPAHRAAAP
jgi:3-deoxy-7-phosphoheptulonate synthase